MQLQSKLILQFRRAMDRPKLLVGLAEHIEATEKFAIAAIVPESN